MEIVIAIVVGVAILVIGGALRWIWSRIFGKPAREENTPPRGGVSGNVTGSATTGDQSPAASEGGIAAGRDIIIHHGRDEEHRNQVEPEQIFDKENFRHTGGGFPLTQFSIAFKIAGPSAAARAGAVAKGDHFVVCFQAQEATAEGLAIWLTVENQSLQSQRWFGCSVTAFGRIPYDEISPKRYGDGSPFLYDIYAGEQYTCNYFFPFPDHVTGPRMLTCNSWDKSLVFWWSQGH